MTSEVQINETGTNEVPLLTVTEKVGYGFGDLLRHPPLDQVYDRHSR